MSRKFSGMFNCICSLLLWNKECPSNISKFGHGYRFTAVLSKP